MLHTRGYKFASRFETRRNYILVHRGCQFHREGNNARGTIRSVKDDFNRTKLETIPLLNVGRLPRDARRIKNNEKWKFANNILLEKTINDFIPVSAPTTEHHRFFRCASSPPTLPFSSVLRVYDFFCSSKPRAERLNAYSTGAEFRVTCVLR